MRLLTVFLSIFIALVFASHSFCADTSEVVLPPGSRTIEKVIGLPGLKNVGIIEDSLYRGAQPEEPEGYDTLKKMGVRTVLNLRSRHSERKEVESRGMKSIEIPMKMLENPEAEEVELVVKAMADPALRPMYVHCALGEDRTGVVVAVYRMKRQGWSLGEAESEMQDMGFNDIWIHLKRFLRSYSGERDD